MNSAVCARYPGEAKSCKHLNVLTETSTIGKEMRSARSTVLEPLPETTISVPWSALLYLSVRISGWRQELAQRAEKDWILQRAQQFSGL